MLPATFEAARLHELLSLVIGAADGCPSWTSNQGLPMSLYHLHRNQMAQYGTLVHQWVPVLVLFNGRRPIQEAAEIHAACAVGHCRA